MLTLRPITAAERTQIRADYRHLRRYLSVDGTVRRITQARQVFPVVVRNICRDLIDEDHDHLRGTRKNA